MPNSGLSPGQGATKDPISWMLIDINARGCRDLAKFGVYKYVLSPNFEGITFSYSVTGGTPITVELSKGKKIPQDILEDLTNPKVIKLAYDANFKRVCLSRYLRRQGIALDPDNSYAEYLNPHSWRCMRVWAASLGLPQSLEGVVKVLGLKLQDMDECKSPISLFCTPCSATEANGFKTCIKPADAPGAWAAMIKYSTREMEVELQLLERLSKHPLPEFIWASYALGETINDRGIGIDTHLAHACIDLKAWYTKKLTETVGLENLNNEPQPKKWLEKHGYQRLWLQLQASKNSVTKYDAMMNTVCSDNRIRGMFRFFGASRTGRFTGHLVQLQNLPKNHIPDIAQARALVASKDYEAVEMLYDDPADIMSQLTRTALIPQDGRKFIVADYNAIEARVVAWLAGEQWKMDAFERGEDIYSNTASQMFHVPVVKNGINGELRARGKVAELACSYGGGKDALIAMGALEMGLKEEKLEAIVKSWRAANSKIEAFWYAVDRAAKIAIMAGISTSVGHLKFSCEDGFLFITLPSGRRLAYANPRIDKKKFGDCITYEGTVKKNNWERMETWGGKLVENIVQGVSLDLLLYAMETLRDYDIVAHVHDEVIIEANRGEPCEIVCKLMGQTPPWAPGLILRADGYECDFYMKD